MSHSVSIKELEQAIAGGQCIAVRTDRVIWVYHKIDEGWVRIRTELPSLDAAETRLIACADEGALTLEVKASADPSAVLKWFDEALHARVSDSRTGFISCGSGSTQEPAIAVCAHVLHGARPSFYKAPVPEDGAYGDAYCADCASKPGLEHIRIVCYRCYLQSQISGWPLRWRG